jgi:hypothetical protein
VPFFCPKSGARILAPGLSTTAGGDIPVHRGSERCAAAESAARHELAKHHPHPNEAPGAPALAASVKAARAAYEAFVEPTAAKVTPVVTTEPPPPPAFVAPRVAPPEPPPEPEPPVEPAEAEPPSERPTTPGAVARPKKAKP